MIAVSGQRKDLTARWLATGLLLLAALLPVYGPWVQPDFAGRMPRHKHVHFGQYDPGHHHEAAEPANASGKESAVERFAELLSSIIFLPDYDVTFEALFGLFLLAAMLLILDAAIYSTVDVRHLSAAGICVAPAEIPPRKSR